MTGLRRGRTSVRTGATRAAGVGALALTIAAGLVPAAHAVEGAPATGAAAEATVKVRVGEVRACSGALLNASWVITAAACFADAPGEAVPNGAPKIPTTVIVGLDDTSDGTTVRVERLVVHPDRDVVLARLASPVTGVEPVAVASEAPVDGEQLTVAGYGRTSTLWVPDSVHTATYAVASVGESTLDIAATETGSTICKGDAGGPALRATTDGGVELVAIHHTAYQGGCLGQTSTAQGATETRVDDLRAWIGWNTPLTQRTPVGKVESIVPDRGQVTISGWAWDPDVSRPINVHVYIDGKAAVAHADADRPDLASQLGTAPTTRGWSHTRELSNGNHQVCVYAIDVGPGPNPLLGTCQDFTINTRTPIGSIDAVVHDTGQISVSGWAWDPDTPSPTDVHVYVDGVAVAAVRADLDRPDVARVHNTAPTRGFAYTRAVSPGDHRVCVYIINIGPGDNPLLGCRDVSVDTRTPIGSIDSVTVQGGQVVVGGWTWDPDTPSPTEVHFYIDGVGVGAVRANLNRPDVAAVYGTAPTRGFAYSRVVAPGNHTICIYAINIGPGPNPLLGCRPFTI